VVKVTVWKKTAEEQGGERERNGNDPKPFPLQAGSISPPTSKIKVIVG